MSERSKGDVSSRINNNASRVVKNPLLSASVTGLSFDDFPNKPLLLPAAPPVVHAPPPQPTTALIAGILNREPKTLVTVGQPSSIDDNEALDEINLNATSSDDSAAANTSITSYQSGADANANPLLEPPTASDSLLSQAASSFGALPSVASNVFSTFSKRIYAGNRDSEEQQPPATQPQLDIQPTYIQQVGQAPPGAVPFYAAPPALAGEAAPEPPKFYAPAEVPNLSTGAPPLPPTSAGQNTYRISARKKLYAPIPGLSEQQQQHHQLPAVASPFQTPPYPTQPAPAPAAFEPAPVQEERKSGGGLFSLSNLVPTGVLQNISGLVQSATGRSSEPAAPGSYNAGNVHPGDYFDISTIPATNPQQPTNFLPPTFGAPPVVGGYFVPTEAPPTVGGFFAPPALAAAPEIAPPPTLGGFFTPTPASAPAVAPPSIFGQPPATSQLLAGAQPPSVVQPTPHPPPPVGQPEPFVQPPVAAPTSVAATPLAVDQPTAVAQIQAQPPAVGYPPAVTQPALGHQPPIEPPPASAQLSALIQPPTGVQPAPFGQPPVEVASSVGIPAFDQPPSVVQAAASTDTSAAVAPPPAGTLAPPPAGGAPPPAGTAPAPAAAAPPPAGAIPPPAAALTQSSYRLQKGTRHYKNPLTAQETATPTAAFSQPTAFAPTPIAPASAPAIFNPFGAAQPQEVALFAPPASRGAEASQGVSLFAVPPATPLTSLVTPQATTATQLFQETPAQEASGHLTPAPGPTAGLQELPLHPAVSISSHFTADSSRAPEVPLYPAPGPVPEIPLFPAARDLQSYPAGPAVSFFAPQPSAEPQARQPEPAPKAEQQGVPLVAPPPAAEAAPGVALHTPGELFPPQEPQVAGAPEATPDPIAETAPATEEVTQGNLGLFPSAPAEQEIPLFVPVPPAAAPDGEPSQGVELYPPEQTKEKPVEDSSTNEQLAPPTTTTTTESAAASAQDTLSTNTLFAPLATAETIPAALPPAPTAAQVASFAPSLSASDLFGSPSAALTTQTTTTFFNPFAQTITTPLPQDLLPPPIGFVSPGNQVDGNALFAAQTIEPVLAEAEIPKATAAPPLPPPAAGKQTNAANPFRRSHEAAAPTTAAAAATAPSTLLSFFTPAAVTSSSSGNSNDFGFFGAAPVTEVTQQLGGQFPELPAQAAAVAPPALAEEPPAGSLATPTTQSTHSLGFEQLISDSQQASQQAQNSTGSDYQNSSANSFSGYFSGPGEAAAPEAQPQPLTGSNSANFFDHFAAAGQVQEDQRIQNFFNNPPPQDQPSAPGELKYDLVHSGLQPKRFEERSQTSVSNRVEPPSSACSELSTIASASTHATQSAPQPDRQSAAELLRLHQGELPEEILQQLRMASEKDGASAPPTDAIIYTPALPHWFYKRVVDGKFFWTPFSHYDSALLETSLTSDETDSTCIVPVEGGRYDVNIKERTKTPVYWEGKAIEVRRCSWFYKGIDGKYVPYAEETAAALEIEYKRATETNEWHKKIPLANGELVTMHGPTVIVHFMPPANGDSWGSSVQSSTRPLVVKRDLNDFKIQQGESQRVDHLLFMVHGIGSACDLKMRNVEEVVDDFRNIAQQLVQSHYKNSTDMGLVGRVEVLPIEWHGHLHSEELGIDEKLRSITLESIPRLRNFTNDTLLDVLFYTSPKYCQKIMNTVADALNEVYLKYRMRHPEFNGGVSLAGHSLGSLILFDLLCHQEPLKESEEENKENPDQLPQKHSVALRSVALPNNERTLERQVSYAMGMGVPGTGQPVIKYTQLIFHPKKFFALGSPIGMFVTIRGIDKLGLDFRLPTCPGFYNIFHPFDPVAYRIEALVNPDMKGIRPVLIPHHKGRKRMHLELKETMTRVGADIKQRFMDTFKTTLDSVNFLATVTKVKKEAEESLEKETSQVFQQSKQGEDQDELSTATTSTQERQRTESESSLASDPEFIELDFPLGKLNDSKRVDYVLQEAPLEFINEYIFALSSHVCYWGSEDTILFVMREIYAGLGISTDSQVPQQSMTIERPSSRTSSASQSLMQM